MCFMRNLVGKSDSMAKYSLLRVDGGRREENGEPSVSYESVCKISVFFHKVFVCVFVCEIFYLRIGFLCEEISL